MFLEDLFFELVGLAVFVPFGGAGVLVACEGLDMADVFAVFEKVGDDALADGLGIEGTVREEWPHGFDEVADAFAVFFFAELADDEGLAVVFGQLRAVLLDVVHEPEDLFGSEPEGSGVGFGSGTDVDGAFFEVDILKLETSDIAVGECLPDEEADDDLVAVAEKDVALFSVKEKGEFFGVKEFLHLDISALVVPELDGLCRMVFSDALMDEPVVIFFQGKKCHFGVFVFIAEASDVLHDLLIVRVFGSGAFIFK
ncbi:hypothetical protein AUTU_46360 (plasmid) [Aureibacter tunicatorum]|nr:hypothetical protein AUTU_31230 [Aureibacter tunicatorum]BDD07147.1 hypothetical protein AUTU_46300 [Aureibacter tunicatorum]BDD07153.1 hypothetical protein AUTU_46360 [Aureibacter tunicatorum]